MTFIEKSTNLLFYLAKNGYILYAIYLCYIRNLSYIYILMLHKKSIQNTRYFKVLS